MEVSWFEQRGAVLARCALCSSSCASSQPRRSLDTRLSSAAAKACVLFCVAVVVVILAGACLRRRRVPHAVLVQEGAGRGAAVHSCGGADGSASRRDARAPPCFASICWTPALVTNTEGCWRGWAVAAHWFCHRCGAEWDGALARKLHDKHDMQSTQLAGLLICLYAGHVLEGDVLLVQAEEKSKPGHAKPVHSKPAQLQASSLKPVRSKPVQ